MAAKKSVERGDQKRRGGRRDRKTILLADLVPREDVKGGAGRTVVFGAPGVNEQGRPELMRSGEGGDGAEEQERR